MVSIESTSTNTKTRFLSLLVSESCNLSCVYCYEKGKTSSLMSIDTAKSVFNEFYNNSQEYDNIFIEFFGAEPLYAFDMIRSFCEWIKSGSFEKPIGFKIITNGTKLSPTMKKWFIENKDSFFLYVSIDGTEEMQRINRGCSVFDIDYSFFLQNWPHLPVRMTVSPYTLSKIVEGTNYLHSLGFPRVSSHIAIGDMWDAHDSPLALAEQLKELSDYYLQLPSDTQSLPNTILIGQLFQIFKTKKGKDCNPGERKVTASVAGELFQCHLQAPLSTAANTFKKISSQCLFMEDCLSCCYCNICPTCEALNFIFSKDCSINSQKVICALSQVIVQASVYFQSNLIVQKRKNLCDWLDIPNERLKAAGKACLELGRL